MSCRLLNQIFRVTQTNYFHPILQKIMLNAFPNNNSYLKNTTTSFYTILTSNIYKNHNLAKQKNALKSSARLESDITCNKHGKSKAKVCKPKKKTPKLKYTKIRICQSEDKCKEKMICFCMPISKFNDKRSITKLNEEESHEMKKCPTVLCTKGTQSFCWVPPQKKPCPVQTWILGGPAKTCARLPCYAKTLKPSSILDRKSSQPANLMKPRSSINCCVLPSENPSPTDYIPINFVVPSNKQPPKKTDGSVNNCEQPSNSKQLKSINTCAPLKQQGVTYMCTSTKQPGSVNSGAQPKQPNIKVLKN